MQAIIFPIKQHTSIYEFESVNWIVYRWRRMMNSKRFELIFEIISQFDNLDIGASIYIEWKQIEKYLVYLNHETFQIHFWWNMLRCSIEM